MAFLPCLEKEVDEDQFDAGTNDGYRAHRDAWIVAAFELQGRFLAGGLVDGLLGLEDAAGRFDGDASVERRASGPTAEDAARMVGGRAGAAVDRFVGIVVFTPT